MDAAANHGPTAAIIGASRGLGFAIAEELLNRGWHVIATTRGEPARALHELVARHAAEIEIETLDVNEPAAIAALRWRLSGRSIDILFVNAGTTTQDEHVPVGAVSTGEFTRVMVTNALGPMRVVEALQDLVPANGLIGAMSSGQGSIANNEVGMREVYRASKAALNMLMRSFAARDRSASRAVLVLAPGWIKTALGGPDATYTVEESAPLLTDVLLSKRMRPGIEFLDRNGTKVPW